ncbi:lipase [Lacinutrix sp. Hel_I_90]|uniref:SGNH/GDSL hydrolase family protein n=1 Tax=Lacinutrix sp. Hel_I_90 TaxID=1249999 RepID=UPI0005C8B441|nr:lipase [Lacinutrix sp. Hel_I_90]
MKNIKYLWLLAIALGLTACNDESDFEDMLETPEPAPALEVATAGSADFSTFVSVGASFTAGYTDNALFIASQENSFPNIMAKEFAKVGGGTFSQPLMNDNYGGLILGGSPVINPVTNQRLFTERLVFGGAGPVPLQSVNPSAMSTTDFALNNPTGPFNNFGVPGAKSFHMIAPGYGNLSNFPAAANPYAIRMTGSTPNASMLELAVAQNATFFTLSEVGGNDVLGYATSGGDGSNPITPTATFDFALNTLVTGLTANGAKGAIGNLPDITSLSFFTTVAHNPVPLDAATANFLNTASPYAAYNAGIVQAYAFLVANTPLTQEMADAEIAQRTIVFAEAEDNALVIIDEDLRDLTALNPALVNLRQATSTDLITLTAASQIPTGLGVSSPMGDSFVLTPQEQQEIADATAAYNASISAAATSNGLALVDLNSILAQAATMGIQFDNYNLSTNLVTGGLISLDGVHLNARGYALMANAFLDAIDTTYGSNFRASGNVAKADDYGVTYSPSLQ